MSRQALVVYLETVWMMQLNFKFSVRVDAECGDLAGPPVCTEMSCPGVYSAIGNTQGRLSIVHLLDEAGKGSARGLAISRTSWWVEKEERTGPTAAKGNKRR